MKNLVDSTDDKEPSQKGEQNDKKTANRESIKVQVKTRRYNLKIRVS